MILGIDEVGRGPWAGPLVVGACILPDNYQIDGLTDSKLLSKKKRERLSELIMAQAIGYGLGWVSAKEIDEVGLSKSLTLATKRALSNITAPYDKIIIDGIFDFLGDPRVSVLKQADKIVPAVSAASIIAKVARDNYMIEAAELYPSYGFENHVGYGTAKHIEAIKKFGACKEHRLSFKPLIKYKTEPSIISVGSMGENYVAKVLEDRNFEILSKNWKTKIFEVDIVARKEGSIYLVEVKTRKNNDFGGGTAAIDSRKLKKLRLAAKAIEQKYPKSDIRILAAIVEYKRDEFRLTDLIDVVS